MKTKQNKQKKSIHLCSELGVLKVCSVFDVNCGHQDYYLSEEMSKTYHVLSSHTYPNSSEEDAI